MVGCCAFGFVFVLGFLELLGLCLDFGDFGLFTGLVVV